GGFAVPLRNDHADTVYIVTSGEFMSIYAANNILRGTANYNPDRMGGIIFNSRGDDEERERVARFSKAVDIPVIAEFARSRIFLEAERIGKTLIEAFPDSEAAKEFFRLAETVMHGKKYTAKPLSESELESTVLDRSVSDRR
ncbi:MAG: nitrogenase reductase, partial [Methanomassiliicoccaceae archaeon]|nr:nitrogenase reductase [Methanomassiliicoccaceae archaeon]